MPAISTSPALITRHNAQLESFAAVATESRRHLAATLAQHRAWLTAPAAPATENAAEYTELANYWGGTRSVLIPARVNTPAQARAAARKLRIAGADNYEVARWLRSHTVHLSASILASQRQQLRRNDEETDALLSRSLVSRMQSADLRPDSYAYQQAVGIEIECFGDPIDPARLPYWARVAGDGSISPMRTVGNWHCDNPHGIEIRMLTPRSVLELRLDRICRLLKNHRVNKSTGLHVHFDMRGRDEPTVYKIAQRVDKWLAALAELVPASRRTNSYCLPGISRSQRYRRVNFTSYGKHRTLEIRFHSGTVDYTKILAWVRLCELLIAMKATPRAQTTLAALDALPLADHDKAYWHQRHRELNPGLYTAPDARPAAEME